MTDADGNLVSQSTKAIPFNATAEGQAYGSSLKKGDDLSDLLSQYAANRYDAYQNSYQQQAMQLGSDSGVDVQA